MVFPSASVALGRPGLGGLTGLLGFLADSDRFLKGFAKGALEVWKEMKKKL